MCVCVYVCVCVTVSLLPAPSTLVFSHVNKSVVASLVEEHTRSADSGLDFSTLVMHCHTFYSNYIHTFLYNTSHFSFKYSSNTYKGYLNTLYMYFKHTHTQHQTSYICVICNTTGALSIIIINRKHNQITLPGVSWACVCLSGIPKYRYFWGDITGIICIRSLSVYRYFCLYRISLLLLSTFQPVSTPKHTHNTLITQHTHLHLYPRRSSCPNTS